MTLEELLYYASLFNLLHTWRFSFGRKASKSRIKDLEFERDFHEFERKNKINLEILKTEMIKKFKYSWFTV